MPVSAICNHNAATIEASAGIAEAAQRMGVRRVPVVNDKGELSGVLAIDDVLDHLAIQINHIAGVIRVEQQKEERTRP